MRLLAATLALLLLIGCEPTEPSLVGDWTGKIEIGDKDKALLSADDMRTVEARMKMLTMQLHVVDDGSYTLNAMDDGSKGTWAMVEGKLVLTDTVDDGENALASDKQEFTVEEAGTRLVGTDPSGGSDSKLVFTRAKVE